MVTTTVTLEEMDRILAIAISNFIDAAYRYDQETRAIEWVMSIDVVSGGENPNIFPYINDQYMEDESSVK